MKLKEIWEWIKKVAQPEKQVRKIDIEDPYATIKHKTKTLGFRNMKRHNNRKPNRARHIQYIKTGKYTKPIYHGGF
jgi:hypothetical protein